MNFVIINRLLKSGVTSFFRNIWVSIAATSMVAITLFIITTILVLYTLTVLSINNSTDKVGVITAYFKDTVLETEIQELREELELMPNVKSIDYTPKLLARDIFIERHKNDPKLLESLNEFTDAENPIPASLSIKTDKLTDYQGVYETLQGDRYAPFFQSIRDNQKVIDKLHKIIDFITKFGIVLALIFIVVTIMVTFNTIRLTIYNRREEVEIMRLVGATNWYIRWPFLIEGFMYALIATIFTSMVTLSLLYMLSSRIEQFLSLSDVGTSLIQNLFVKSLIVNLVASIVLSFIASSIAIRRYLRI